MKDEQLIALQHLIYEYCGITISGAHLEFLKRYVKNRLDTLGLSFDSFYKTLLCDKQEFELLINSITINETYFFREEKQFLYLHTEFLSKYKNKKLRLWSSACSTGEEAYSLAALCKNHNVEAEIFASDINTDSMLQLQKGVYKHSSIREDGKKLTEILKPHATFTEKEILVSNELKEMVFGFPFNLFRFEGCKECLGTNLFDIIFIRNVFIYFSEETKQACLKFMEERLKPGGILFTSTNEIASVPVPFNSSLKKIKKADVFFFYKEDNRVC